MLETIREFGAEQIAERGEAERLGRAHALAFIALAERAEVELTGPDQAHWLARLQAEHDNLRTALDWLTVHDPGLAVNLAGRLWRFWWTHGDLVEGRRRMET